MAKRNHLKETRADSVFDVFNVIFATLCLLIILYPVIIVLSSSFSDAKALMASLYESLYDGMIPQRDNAEIFHQRRITVLDVLQTITADPASGIAALEARM